MVYLELTEVTTPAATAACRMVCFAASVQPAGTDRAQVMSFDEKLPHDIRNFSKAKSLRNLR